MSLVALKGCSRAAAGTRYASGVGCSYLSQQQQYHQRGTEFRRSTPRSFSTSSKSQILGQVGDMYRNVKDRAYKGLGKETSQEKDERQAIDAMKPDSEKALARLQRRRWGRPMNVVVDERTGKVEKKITEHKYSTAYFRISHRKLQMLAHQIGEGKPIDYAILQMQFSQKRAAKRIKSTLALAKDHAVVKGLDPAKLVVAEAWVGKGRTFKRVEFKGRGRVGIRKSFQAKLSIVLREGKTWETKQREKFEKEVMIVRRIGTGGVVRTNLPVINTHQRAGWQW